MAKNWQFLYQDSEPQRLDVLLLSLFADDPELKVYSRSQIKKIIEDGLVLVNSKKILKSGTILKTGARIEVADLPDRENILTPYDFKLRIVHEDADLMVIDKPAGISMHPGAGNKNETLLNAIIGKLDKKYLKKHERPGIIHRLDKDTTGLVVVAKNAYAHDFISKQFAARTVDRAYYALVVSTPRANRLINKSESGEVTAAIGRHQTQRTKMAVPKDAENGRSAKTSWEVLERFNYGSLLKLKLSTGRTHQIRVHMEHIGSPVIGDKVYGNTNLLPKTLQKLAEDFPRQALHAGILGFQHPVSGKQVIFSSEMPDDMLKLINEFRIYSK